MRSVMRSLGGAAAIAFVVFLRFNHDAGRGNQIDQIFTGIAVGAVSGAILAALGSFITKPMLMPTLLTTNGQKRTSLEELSIAFKAAVPMLIVTLLVVYWLEAPSRLGSSGSDRVYALLAAPVGVMFWTLCLIGLIDSSIKRKQEQTNTPAKTSRQRTIH